MNGGSRFSVPRARSLTPHGNSTQLLNALEETGSKGSNLDPFVGERRTASPVGGYAGSIRTALEERTP
jgi:hypothetical protein